MQTKTQISTLLRIIVSLGILLSMCGAVPLPDRQPHITFFVDSTLDAVDANIGDGRCATSSGDCTLRAATQETNALPGLDTIILPAGTYLITIPGNDNEGAVGDFNLNDDLIIQGAGAAETIVDAQQIDRVFHVWSNTNVQLQDLTIQNGYEDGYSSKGGGIWNSGNLTLVNCSVRDNQTAGSWGYGGGIYSNGKLLLRDSLVTQNQTNGWNAHGGGLYVRGAVGETAVIANSTITHNAVGAISGNGNGGGLYQYESSRVTIRDSLLQENYATAYGGGIFSSGDLVITSTRLISNTTDGMNGGGIHINGFNGGGTLQISDCEIVGNSGGNRGGGIAMENNASLTMDHCRVAANDAQTSGGGLATAGETVTIRDSVFEHNQGNLGHGGAIAVRGSNNLITLENVVLQANQARMSGGGIAAQSYETITITNSTLSQNQAAENGGGIWGFSTHAEDTIILEQVTLTANMADSDADGVGEGGGIYLINDTVLLQNTLLAGNVNLSPVNRYPDCAQHPDYQGTYQSQGYNLVGAVTGCNFQPDVGDLIGTAGEPLDPRLGPLQDNGGETLTHALLPGSPAVDAVPRTACELPTDQRGVARPQGRACDSGAFERPFLTVLKTVSNPEPRPGETLTYTIQVANNLTTTITGGLISDTLPTGLNFLGPITLEPPLSGTVSAAPPVLVTNLALGPDQQVTVTFPVSVSYGLAGGTVLTNTASLTSSAVITPVLGRVPLTVQNVPPVAVNDFGTGYVTTEDAAFTTDNVLANDHDLNDDPLLVTEVLTTTLRGLLIDHGDGTFAYDPHGQFEDLFPGEVAYDLFRYVASDGVLTDTAQVTITIQGVNDHPIVDAGPDQTVDEGQLVQFEGRFRDPGLHLPSAVSGLQWAFGDGATATGTLTPTHAYLDNGPVASGGTYTVTLTVTDTHGGTASDGLQVMVENVAPTLNAFPDQEAFVGETITITGTITDLGVLDTQTVAIGWGDGFTETLSLAADERQFELTHTYAERGQFPVTIWVTDKDGGWDQRSFTVMVKACWIYLPHIQR